MKLRKEPSLDVAPSMFSIFENVFGFHIDELLSWTKLVKLMYKPMDPASLGVMRALFGLMMVLDIPEERGLAEADVIWGNPKSCHFPLLEFITPLPLQWMCIVYAVMWAGAVGIMLGIFYKLSCIAFIIPYGYIFLLDKCAWNNHSYLYGVTAVLLLGTGANHYCSLDIFFGKVKWNTHVPLWNYAILRFQFFILYFFAGLKKMDQDWLDGYSMANLSNHWLFEPLKKKGRRVSRYLGIWESGSVIGGSSIEHIMWC